MKKDMLIVNWIVDVLFRKEFVVWEVSIEDRWILFLFLMDKGRKEMNEFCDIVEVSCERMFVGIFCVDLE